jgi:hypothetical protein
MHWTLLGGALIIAAGIAQAQAGNSARPEFAVTSVKPNHTGCCTTWGPVIAGAEAAGKT